MADDLFAALAAARDWFRSRLGVVSADDWARRTPCAEWDVRNLVEHVFMGDLAVRPMLGLDLEGVPGPSYDGNVEMLADAWAAAASDADAAFAEPGALGMRVSHPFVDGLDGERLLGFRLTDNLVHGWDLARAIGIDDRMPSLLVELVLVRLDWEGLPPLEAGLFASPVGLGADSDPQTRMLARLGRDPEWTPGRDVAETPES